MIISKLPSCDEKWEVDFEFQRLDNNMGLFSPQLGAGGRKSFGLGDGTRARRRSSFGGRLSLDGEALMKDILPPASPATILLLQRSGFTDIPEQKASEVLGSS